MHISIAILTIIASLKWGDWKNWRKHQAGMLFTAGGGMLYEYIVNGYSLWKFHPDFLIGHEMTVILYDVITMPISILIFLSHFPKKLIYRVIYILLWSGIYIVVEYILFVSRRISYQYGWGMWYSFLFDLTMFSIIALHQYKPVRAYILSVFVTIFLIIVFKVPFHFAK